MTTSQETLLNVSNEPSSSTMTTAPPSGGSWNALFLTWIQESCRQYSTSNTNLHQIYQKAQRSLKACPKQFSHPAELKELKFFGPSICKALETKLQTYCESNGIPVPESAVPAPSARSAKRGAATAPKETSTKPPAKRKKNPWVPRFRGGGYAILLTLYHHDSVHSGTGMTKTNIIRLAEPLCDASFKSNPTAGTFYSAWSSITTLLKNEVVYASGTRNATYYITEEGKRLAEKLLQAEREARPFNSQAEVNPASRSNSAPEFSSPRNIDISTVSSVQAVPPQTPNHANPSPNTFVRNQIALLAPTFHSTTPASPTPAHREIAENSFRSKTWPPGSFSIKVIIDNREVGSSEDRNFFHTALLKLGIAASVEVLSVGDVVWIAEHNVTKEIAVLDYILERKRLDDLVSSIKDGRFKEQKGRLKRSGIKNIIYLVEDLPGMDRGFAEQIQTAMAQAITADDFFLKRTTSPSDTANYLAKVANSLTTDLYKDSTLSVTFPSLSSIKSYTIALTKAREENDDPKNNRMVAIDFDSFQAAMSKSGMLTLRDIFIRMLLTIRGITLDKATAIQKVYATPRDLFDAYKALTSEDDKKLLLFQKLGNNISRKKITKLLSERVYNVWGLQ